MSDAIHGEPSGDATELVSTTCPFCAVGCGLVLEVARGAIAATRPARAHPVSRGQLCVKGWNADRAVEHGDRLTRPLLRRGAQLEPATMAEALEAAARLLRDAIAESGPAAVGVIASARATNEDAFAAMKLARAVLGTNNIDHCARVCHAPSVAGLGRTLGSGAMTSSIADLEHTDCILVVGADPTENHPIIGARILEAKARGARLVVVDPRRTRLTHFADLHLRLSLGSDIALVAGLIHAIFAHGWEARSFLERHCTGLAALRASVADDSPERVSAATGVAASDIVEAARLFATAERAMLVYGLGVTQHVCGTETVIALSNLALVAGQVGREGAGINPLRGQNNVQGACDMGALPDVLSGYQRVCDAAARGRFATAWGVGLPEEPGLTALAMERAARDGLLRAMLILGEDPLVTDPAHHVVERAFSSLDGLIVCDLYLTETAKLADVVLPAASFAEKEGTFTSTERRVQRVRRAVAPPGEALPDWQILDAIAARLGRPMGFRSAAQVFDEMASLTPLYGGMSHARLDREPGLQWPCPSADHPGTPVLHRGGFAAGKAHLLPVHPTPPAETPDASYPFALTTFRLHHQYGCGSMTRRVPLLERENPRGLLWLHPRDAAALGVATGDRVRVRSRRGEVRTRALVSDEVSPGVVAMPYHFAEANPNRVTNDALDPLSRMPELKVCAVAVEAER